MAKSISLKNIKEEYQQAIQSFKMPFNLDEFMELSIHLFDTIKAKNVYGADEDGDMLLFQCGKFDWNDELGEHFAFDITRQFITKTDRTFQLSFILIFNPDDFKNIEGYTFWHTDFSDMEEWQQNVKATEAYKKAKIVEIPKYKLTFGEL